MKKLIKCGKLYDGVQNSIQNNMEILIDGKVIESVGHNLPVPNGTEIIDLSDCTVTPGMIDAHVHSQYVDWHTRNHDIVYRGGMESYVSFICGTGMSASRFYHDS